MSISSSRGDYGSQPTIEWPVTSSGGDKSRSRYAHLQAVDCGVTGYTPDDFYTESSGSMQEQAIDYSSQNFEQSLAAISTAAQSGVRVRTEGDTTVVTEHRDPYSFYWQLDRFRRPQPQLPPAPPGPPLPPPQQDVDVEETVLQTAQVQSPDSHDSGIQVEQPRRPMPPAMQPPPQEEQDYSHYWHVDPLLRDADVQADEPIKVIEKVVEIDRPVPMPTPAPIIIQQQPVIEEHAFKQTTTKRTVDDEHDRQQQEGEWGEQPVRFAVRSLGWTEIGEEELTPEKSSRAVNKAIVDLATGRHDLLDNVAKWGDGKELIMELDDRDLRLVDPDSGTLLHTQPIHQIRVWGVGRDNARTIANTLRDICKRLMAERRPSSLPERTAAIEGDYGEHSFPTPMEEPKKVIRCHFLGVTQVPRATGIDILNDAVDRLVAAVRPERWILVDAAIAPSTIIINEVGGGQIAECRIRSCAFIMHTSAENFMCYVFHVEPSAGAMAKTIEAACKLRYQALGLPPRKCSTRTR